MKISVIIPVYKVEQYLAQCVDSVLNQTYRDLEVILVDDGSPDRCPQMCDDYAAKDPRVRVIHQKNGGSSAARNAGVAVATGEYGLFLDSDDFWNDEEAVFRLAQRISAQPRDVICFSWYKYTESDGTIIEANKGDSDMPKDADCLEKQLGFLTDRGLYSASACDKMISMQLLKRLPFEPGMFSEDVEWSARLMNAAGSFDYINSAFYCYRQREGSVSHTISEKSCRDLANAVVGCCTITEQSDAAHKPYLGRYSAYQFATFIAVQAFTETFSKETIQTLRPYAGILQYYANSRKVRYMYYGVRMMGFVNWCRLIRGTKSVWDSRRDRI